MEGSQHSSLGWDSIPNTPRPVFFVRRTDRLLARIKHLLYALRLARRVDGVVAMIWPDQPARVQVYDGPNYHPGLIFDLDALRSSDQAKDLIFLPGSTSWLKSGASLRDPVYAKNRNNKFAVSLFDEPNLKFYEDSLLNFRFADEPTSREWLDQEVRAVFQQLPLTREVTDGVERVQGRMQCSDYVSVHFRAGDVYGMLKEALPAILDGSLPDSRLTLLLGHLVTRTSPIEFFDEHVSRAIDEGKTILFSSDTPTAIASFQSRYGSNRFVDLAAFQASEPIQKAMIDFCAMSGGTKVLGSRGNYGSMAALVGGAEMVIVSAAACTTKNTDEAIGIYQQHVIDVLSVGAKLPAKVVERLDEEIRRRFIYVNRLADAETIKSLDPRPAIREVK